MKAATNREADVAHRSVVAPDGVVLELDVAGDPSAPCVVLLHGGGQTRHSWSNALRVLARAGYQVVAYDSRGHGESGWSPDGAYSFPQRAEDLRAVLSEFGHPAALVGASMGGITAMQAIGSGLRVSALVLVDIVLRPDRSGVQRVRDFMAAHADGFAKLEDAVEAVAAYNPRRQRPGNPSGLMRNLRVRPGGRLYWHFDPRIVPPDLDNDMAEFERISNSFAPTRDTPVMLVRGGDSDVVTQRNTDDFRRLVPHVEIRDVVGAGHMVVGDSNSAFNDAILDFLVRHMPPR